MSSCFAFCKITSNDIITGNGRFLKNFMFIVQLYLFKEIYHVNIFFFFLLMNCIATYNVYLYSLEFHQHPHIQSKFGTKKYFPDFYKHKNRPFPIKDYNKLK